jgi:hypothetical protein
MPYRSAEHARRLASIPEFANWDAGWTSGLCRAHAVRIKTIASYRGIVPAHLLDDLGDDPWDGMVMDFEQGKPVILVRPDMHPRRMHWTIVHELGHILLGHKGTSLNPRPGLCSHVDRRHEDEANRFAREVMLPAEEMRQFLEMGLRPVDIVQFKGASLRAVQLRIKTMHRDGEYDTWTEAS